MSSLIAAIVVLTIITVLWIIIFYLRNPQIENPDGKASLAGNCGDTLEICLKFSNNKLISATHHTTGCTYSVTCLRAATDLAIGKTPDEILKINGDQILQSIGGAAEESCATLAAQTLHAAVYNYLHPSNKHELNKTDRR